MIEKLVEECMDLLVEAYQDACDGSPEPNEHLLKARLTFQTVLRSEFKRLGRRYFENSTEIEAFRALIRSKAVEIKTNKQPPTDGDDDEFDCEDPFGV